MKSFLTTRGMSREELSSLMGRGFRHMATPPGQAHRSLEGTVVASLFFEPSTRTRLSFEMAATRLGGHVLTLLPEHSSLLKEESLRDTVMTVAAMAPQVLVIRHHNEGVPDLAHRWSGLAVVNAGDGTNEHPTQALADLLTLSQQFGDVAGLRVAVIGDVAHSRVAGSLVPALVTCGASVTLVGPPQLLPREPPDGVAVSHHLDPILPEIDAAYLLRVQRERGVTVANGYISGFQLDDSRAARMAPEAVVMHPGPLNRGIEIVEEVADGPRSLVLRQVANGVPARMAVLESIAEGLT